MMNSAEPQQQQPAAQSQAPWWMKYAAKGIGAIGGLVAIGLGAFNCFTLTALYLVAGIWQMVAGFCVTLLEAPFLCLFLDFVQDISKKLDNMSPFVKAGFYICLAIPAVWMCQTISIIIGSGLIFTAGVLNGLMALGKKAPREEMLTNASDKAPIVSDTVPMGTA